jgi:hypothetical protein
VLWQNANADLPGCHAYRKGENDRSLITSDKQNPTAQPGTDCQIEFRLIQFIWDARESLWEEGFAALTAFKIREGHCLVPTQHVEGTFKLGAWVGEQRQHRDTMPAERKQRLNAIGFVWDPHEGALEKVLQR